MAAQGECDMMGGYLAEPKTGTEQDFLRSEIQFFEVLKSISFLVECYHLYKSALPRYDSSFNLRSFLEKCLGGSD